MHFLEICAKQSITTEMSVDAASWRIQPQGLLHDVKRRDVRYWILVLEDLFVDGRVGGFVGELCQCLTPASSCAAPLKRNFRRQRRTIRHMVLCAG